MQAHHFIKAPNSNLKNSHILSKNTKSLHSGKDHDAEHEHKIKYNTIFLINQKLI